MFLVHLFLIFCFSGFSWHLALVFLNFILFSGFHAIYISYIPVAISGLAWYFALCAIFFVILYLMCNILCPVFYIFFFFTLFHGMVLIYVFITACRHLLDNHIFFFKHSNLSTALLISLFFNKHLMALLAVVVQWTWKYSQWVSIIINSSFTIFYWVQ